jgi:GT2 family glycosyltransferase
MRIGFVCTNYNNSRYSRAATASLHDGGSMADVHCVIVDNNSREQDVAALKEIRRDYPAVELLLHGENVGYFAGLNLGIAHLRARWPDLQHIVVGNNDLVFAPDFVGALRRHREIFDTWAVVAPDLQTPTGGHQNPHVIYPISAFRRTIWDLYYRSYRLAVLIKHFARLTRRVTARDEFAPGNRMHETPQPILLGYGACYILGPAFFRHFAQLFAPTFMMQEEFFLAEQLKLIGQTMYYDPRFVVMHHDHASIDELPSRHFWQISQEAHHVYKRFLTLPPAVQRHLVTEGSRFAS